MKNTRLLSLGILLSAGTLLTACSNDDGASDDSPAGSTWTLTVKATKGGNEATTRALSPGGTGNKTLYATWATTEKVYVYYKESGNNYTEHGVLQPNANAAEATLIGNLTGFADNFITNNASGFEIQLQFPREKPITWEGQNGTLDDIAKNFDWATATVKVIADKPVDNNNKILKSTTDASFNNLQAIVKFTLFGEDSDGSQHHINPTAFTVSDGDISVPLTGIPPETYATNGNGILYVAIPGFENKTVTLTAAVDEVNYTYTTKKTVSFTNGNYYDITVKMTLQPKENQ